MNPERNKTIGLSKNVFFKGIRLGLETTLFGFQPHPELLIRCHNVELSLQITVFWTVAWNHTKSNLGNIILTTSKFNSGNPTAFTLWLGWTYQNWASQWEWQTASIPPEDKTKALSHGTSNLAEGTRTFQSDSPALLSLHWKTGWQEGCRLLEFLLPETSPPKNHSPGNRRWTRHDKFFTLKW